MLSRVIGSIWFRLISCFLMMLVLVACSNSTHVAALSRTNGSSQVPSPVSSLPPVLGAPECHPPSPLDVSNIGYPEALATATSTTLWVLFEGGVPPVKTDSKLIWRLGTGFHEPLHIDGLGPQGLLLLPLFLQEHGGSNWNRPGNEWGTGFRFPVAGCWDLHVMGGTAVDRYFVDTGYSLHSLRMPLLKPTQNHERLYKGVQMNWPLLLSVSLS
jgi:hypothetical protein